MAGNITREQFEKFCKDFVEKYEGQNALNVFQGILKNNCDRFQGDIKKPTEFYYISDNILFGLDSISHIFGYDIKQKYVYIWGNIGRFYDLDELYKIFKIDFVETEVNSVVTQNDENIVNKEEKNDVIITKSNFIGSHPKLFKCLKIALIVLCLIFLTMYFVNPVRSWIFIGVALFHIYLIFFKYEQTNEDYIEYGYYVNGSLQWTKKQDKSVNYKDTRIVTPQMHKKRIRNYRIFSVCSLCIISSIVYANADNNIFYDYMYKTHVGKVTRTSYPVETSLERISCTSVNKITKKFKVDSVYDTYEHHNLFGKNYFKGTLISSNKSVYKIISNIPINDTLKINGISCNDTISTVNSIPYNDRNFSLIQINKKFINNQFKFIDTTYYKNLSPKINDGELSNIFNDLAKFTYDNYVSKYTVKFIDETTIDTLNTFSEAEEKRNSKCKQKATLIKFNYSEYDACIKNNNIEEISIVSREWCGTNKIKLSYNEGTLAATPYNCLDKINVLWEYYNRF